MSQEREDEFIEAWAGTPRTELTASELDAARKAFFALQETDALIGLDAEEMSRLPDGFSEADMDAHIKQLGMKLNALPVPGDSAGSMDFSSQQTSGPTEATSSASSQEQSSVDATPKDNVIPLPRKTRKTYTAVFSAIAACLALAVGINVFMEGPQQSGDWGQQIVVRGSNDVSTLDYQISVDKPKQSQQELVALLRAENATYRAEKKSGSHYRTVFKLKEAPSSALNTHLAAIGISDIKTGVWYVLDLIK